MATLMCCSGCDHRHHPVHGMHGRVHRLLQMVTLMCCSGCDHKHHPVHGMQGCVHRLLDLADFMCCSGCDRKRRPVHGTKIHVHELLNLAIFMCWYGCDREHHPVRGIPESVCILLREDRKWTCSSVHIYDRLHGFSALRGSLDFLFTDLQTVEHDAAKIVSCWKVISADWL